MGDDHAPRYGLRPSPVKAPQPTPPRIPISPKRFASPLGRSLSTQQIFKDESADRPSSSSAFRKLTFASSSTTASSTLLSYSLKNSDRTLRPSATFYAPSSSSFIPRVRSSICLPVTPLDGRNSAFSVPSSQIFVPPTPLRHANSNPATSTVLHPSQKGGGLIRSIATTRLQPASKLLQDELQSAATPAGTVGIKQTDHTLERLNVASRRVLTSSASVASLSVKQDSSKDSVSRGGAVRVRPPSPVRIAKSNSGLLRSYSSVVIGVKEASKIVSVATEEETTTTFVLAQKEEKFKATPRQSDDRLKPSSSTSRLRCRPSQSKLDNSDSCTHLPAYSHKDKKAELSYTRKDMVLPESERSAKESGPIPSPITRSLKRRLEAGADGEKLEEPQESTMKRGLSSTISTTTPTSDMPSASYFLRDDITPDSTLSIIKNGTGSGLAKVTPETTPKPTRRSKKMRRLEMESGEVDEEARSLASDNSSVSPSIMRLAPCKVMETSRVDYCTSLTTRAIQENVEMREERGEEAVGASFHVTIPPVALPPAPEKSALRSEKREKSGRSIRFAHVDVFVFERRQGFVSVPTSGEVCLGMESRHHGSEHHRLDELFNDGETDGMDEEGLGEIRLLASLPSQSSPRRLPPGEKSTTKHIAPLSPKQRSKMLRLSGVIIPRDPLVQQKEHESIRQRRRECGCSCEGGRCLPETCECSREGIACQVDTDEGPFPCRCRADTCQNKQGRVEFSERHVFDHYQRTFARLKLGERMGNDALPSPSLIRFPDDDDEGPRHNSTSYLATPPPAIYQSPMVTSKALAATTVIAAICPTQPCTPPLQMQHIVDGEGIGGAPQHTRFPVTPVYKKYAGGGGGTRTGKEVPLSRMAIFKAASTASTPGLTEVLSSSPTVVREDLDESIDTSVYATPPEGNSPVLHEASVATVSNTASLPASPIQFPTS